MTADWKRKAGVLLPVFSLDSRYGIGTFGREAKAWVHELAEAGFTYWQVLPLGPTSYGDSPYQSFSAFAGNPYFIDVESLVELGLLTREEAESYDWGDDPARVDYAKLHEARFALLRQAFARAVHVGAVGTRFLAFCKENAYWLPDYALFMALKERFGGKAWLSWPEEIRTRQPEELASAREALKDECTFWEFVQFLFFSQWEEVRAEAREAGVQIIGDIPIYCAMDSADVWAHPELFLMDENIVPDQVAGVPPDYFSADGQLWGNPLYRWEAHEANGYDWWIRRMKGCSNLYDCVRIDHFIGIVRYYCIPYGAENAKAGIYRQGPGLPFIRILQASVPQTKLIAEDLGVIVPEVQAVLDAAGFPGMKVLAFAFGSGAENEYLPHNYTHTNSVVYVGSHDTDTAAGMLGSMTAKDRAEVRAYCGLPPAAGEVPADDGEEEKPAPSQVRVVRTLTPEEQARTHEEVQALIRLALSSVGHTAILQAQDLLCLGSEARINIPSTLGGNWDWRMTSAQRRGLFDEVAPMLPLYGR